jgi:hypothetical protein
LGDLRIGIASAPLRGAGHAWTEITHEERETSRTGSP